MHYRIVYRWVFIPTVNTNKYLLTWTKPVATNTTVSSFLKFNVAPSAGKLTLSAL